MTKPEKEYNPRKAVIYCRVSSRAQEAEGHGLESQETRCRQHAAQKGYEIVAVFPDTISGGGDFMQRPGMVSLLAFLDDQPDDRFVVIFDDLKRFARDTRFHLDLREAFRKRNASIECLNFKFDDTPEGEFIETIMAAQGALERKQNGRQVAQKMKARMQNGYWIHNAPVGYRYETVRGHGKVLTPNEPLASIVREGIEGYASGRFGSQAEVKRFFETYPEFPRNKHGEIVQQRITDILTQPVYTGHICSETYGISWLKGQHEALISIATFDKVQERRAGVAKLPARKNIGDDFALRGFVCCAGCGVPLRSSWSKGRTKSYPYYLCQTKGCDAYGKSMARDKVERDIGDVIKTLQPTHNVVALVKAMFRRAWDVRRAQADTLKASIQKHMKGVDQQIEALMDRLMVATSGNVICRYEDKIDALERAKSRYQDQIVQMDSPDRRTYEDCLEPALQIVTNPWKLWDSGQIALRRLVLKMAFSNRIQYDRNTGPRTTHFTIPFKALTGLNKGNSKTGAQEKTRTSTPIRALAPEASASTNSATWALCAAHLRLRRSVVNAIEQMSFRLAPDIVRYSSHGVRRRSAKQHAVGLVSVCGLAYGQV